MTQLNYREIAEKIVKRGARGVSNKQMLDTLKDILENKNLAFDINTSLTAIYSEYKSIFISSCKYVPDEQKVVLEKFLKTQPGNEDLKLTVGKRTRYMMEMGINPLDEDAKDQLAKLENGSTEKEKIEVIDNQTDIKFASEYKSESAAKLADLVKGNANWKNVLKEEEIRMVIMAVEGSSTLEIAKEFETTSEDVRDQLYKNAGCILAKLA